LRPSSPTGFNLWSYEEPAGRHDFECDPAVIGYPVAYALARAPRRWQATLVLLVVLPFWTSFLIRVYAWINILQHDGLLNQALVALHLIDRP